MFKNKRVLIAGGTGLVGIQLSKLLIEEEGARVRIASLDDKSRAHSDAEFIRTDLTDYRECLRVCERMDYVFNLLCIKGPPGMSQKFPVDSFEPMFLFNGLLIKAAWKQKVSGYLYTSSVAVYQPAEVLYEDDVWTTQPSQNDWFPGHVKRIGELHVEAYKLQYGWNVSVVRPSNIYGPYDNFNSKHPLFMAYIIKQFADKKNPITINGDGLHVRDFIYSEDAARGMLVAAKNSAGPVNLCSGRETTVRKVVEILAKIADYKGEVIYDPSKPSGDNRRVLDVSKLKKLGFEPKISLEKGLENTYRWYIKNRNKLT